MPDMNKFSFPERIWEVLTEEILLKLPSENDQR